MAASELTDGDAQWLTRCLAMSCSFTTVLNQSPMFYTVANNSTAAIRRAIQTQTMPDFWQADAAYTRLLWYSYPSDADS